MRYIMNKLMIVLLLAIGLTACQPEGRVYSKHKKLSRDVEWLQSDTRDFEVAIVDHGAAYNLSISFRYAQGYQYQFARVKVTETSPGGKTLVTEYSLKVREDNGEYIGKPGLDIWDSEHLVEKAKKYEETGTYIYTMEHAMPVDPLYYAMEIGLIIEIAE